MKLKLTLQKMTKTKHLPGFTLIEVLMVIGLIAILGSIVTLAANPGRAFQDARNAERRSEVTQISSAITQYIIDGGSINDFTQGDSDPITVCSSGSDEIVDGTVSDGEVDLTTLLTNGIPSYLVVIPVDPRATIGTGYTICTTGNRYTVSAPLALSDGGETIEVVR